MYIFIALFAHVRLKNLKLFPLIYVNNLYFTLTSVKK